MVRQHTNNGDVHGYNFVPVVHHDPLLVVTLKQAKQNVCCPPLDLKISLARGVHDLIDDNTSEPVRRGNWGVPRDPA